MTYRILYTEEAARRVRKLDGAVKERIRKAVIRISEHPELGKRLTGLLSDRWSYRVGGRQILYKIREAEVVILILTAGHRGKVYNS